MQFPLRSLRAVVCALVLTALFPAQVFAQRVLILVSEDPTMQTALLNDVQSKLMLTGRLEQVDVFDVRTDTPSLEALLEYDAVLTWPQNVYADRHELGNRLADYVDLGHGVVQAMFSFSSEDSGVRLGGRWEAEGYQIFNSGSADMADLTMVPDLPEHPILDGVNTVALSFGFFQPGVVVAPCAEVVAHWSNELQSEPLVAWCPGASGGRIVAMNLYPPSTDAYPFAWVASTDGALLMANALVFAGSAPVVETNRAPTADAGPDQTLEARGPGGAPFLLTGSADDADGDGLTLSWAGPVAGSGAVLTGTLMLPPSVANALSRATGPSYTFTLTVSDGNGGVTTDDVVVTVTDTTAPVLANVPASVMTATATSPSGADVSFGSITATDAVDGDSPVTCSKSGVFPIGDTKVTCSAFDTRGNSASAEFTVRVLDATTAGMMWGDGTIRAGSLRYDVEFAVGELKSYQGALLQVRVNDDRPRKSDSRFSARKTTFVAFSNNPAVRPGVARVDTVHFSGFGDWNGHSGYQFQASAVDKGEHGRSRMVVQLTITAPNGTVVARMDGTLGSGGTTLAGALRR